MTSVRRLPWVKCDLTQGLIGEDFAVHNLHNDPTYLLAIIYLRLFQIFVDSEQNYD